MTRISLRLRRQAQSDFGDQCAYCHTPVWITGAHLVTDHIIPEGAGGLTVLANLCPACHACNESKGMQMDGLDPRTGERVRLFHPRQDTWRAHFQWSEDGGSILGLTASGRATVAALNMNRLPVVQAGLRWVGVGWHPPAEDL